MIEAVAKAEGFEASDEEIKQKFLHLQLTTTCELERVRQLLSPDMLKHDIVIKKPLN